MADPLAEVITLLKPRAVFSKGISGAGAWAVRYSEFGQPSFCAVLEGSCRLAVDGEKPLTLEAGDFVLLPRTPGFTLSGFIPTTPKQLDPNSVPITAQEIRHGDQLGEPDMRLQGGYFVFDSPQADLLASMLPAVVHVQGIERLRLLVEMVREETKTQTSGRELVLARLVELLLIEAIRSLKGDSAPPGLLRAMADARLAEAIRQMHSDPSYPWTVAQLAKKAALSRSAFFDRFLRFVGIPPMEYLLSWRMALAKELLIKEDLGLAEIAFRIGYSSAGTFSTAFSRYVGQSPSQYARVGR